jgi:hypothetical protein
VLFLWILALLRYDCCNNVVATATTTTSADVVHTRSKLAVATLQRFGVAQPSTSMFFGTNNYCSLSMDMFFRMDAYCGLSKAYVGLKFLYVGLKFL